MRLGRFIIHPIQTLQITALISYVRRCVLSALYTTHYCAKSWLLLQFCSVFSDDAMFKVCVIWSLLGLPLMNNTVANKERAPVLEVIMESMGVSVGAILKHPCLTCRIQADGLYEVYLGGCSPVANST